MELNCFYFNDTQVTYKPRSVLIPLQFTCEALHPVSKTSSDYLSGTHITVSLMRPTQNSKVAGHHIVPAWPCSTWGMPRLLHHCRSRCALTAPFHPHLQNSCSEGNVFLCGPSLGYPTRMLSGTLPFRARTFLRCINTRNRSDNQSVASHIIAKLNT